MTKTKTDRRFFRELRNGQLVGYTIGEVTQEEIDEAMAFKRRRMALIEEERRLREELKDCPHKVLYDEPGYIYDLRICLRCGHTQLV